MLKRLLCLALTLILCTGSALATSVTILGEELTDAPRTPTQDVVLEMEAAWLDAQKTPYDVQVMPPADQLTMDTVAEIYAFVVEQNNRPARYFPETVDGQLAKTQKDIAEMYGVDIDTLYMTEFMRLHMAQFDTSAMAEQPDVEMRMLMDVDYQPGQLVVVVLGDLTDPENIEWHVVKAEATALGEVTSLIPYQLMQQLNGEDVLFTLLTVRKGGRGGIVEPQQQGEHAQLPSKTAYDMIRIDTITDANGNPLPEDFRILVYEETDAITAELDMIRAYVLGDEQTDPQTVVSYFPAEYQSEAQLLLGEQVDTDAMVAYEYVPLIAENYRDTYGDALAPFTFATPYEPGQKVVTLLGLPHHDQVDEGETLMDWAVQGAQVKEDGTVEIVFDQLALTEMGEEVALMLVVSEPFED